LIAVDTSALTSVVLGESPGLSVVDAIEAEDRAVISAGTLTEAIIVGTGLGMRNDVLVLIDRLGLEVVPLDADAARRIGGIYQRWGRGFHPAGLNFGDCFAYEVAERFGCPLLYIGNDFAKTDIQSAL